MNRAKDILEKYCKDLENLEPDSVFFDKFEELLKEARNYSPKKYTLTYVEDLGDDGDRTYVEHSNCKTMLQHNLALAEEWACIKESKIIKKI